MSYLVLARKWRPRYFEEVTGQEHVTRTLVNAIKQGRVHHAFLFTGARGVGKTTCARLLAKALNCHNNHDGRPCYACPSCEEITAGTSVDVLEIDGASNRGIDEIRELRDKVKYAPSRDRYKIYIIDEVHMLTEQAFNALLKTLEEPPGHVKFIFATTEPRKIPPTILSRCQRFDFKRIPPMALGNRLREILDAEGVTIDDASLSLVVQEAEGTVRDALSLLDQAISYCGDEITYDSLVEILGLTDRRNLHELARALIEQDPAGVLEVVQRVHGYGHDLARFAAEVLKHLRDLVILRTTRDAAGLVDMPRAEREELGALVARVDPGHLRRLFFLMLDGVREISRSSFPKLVLEMTLLRMLDLAPAVDVAPLVDRLVEMEKRLAGKLPPGGPVPRQGVPRGGPGAAGGPEPTPPRRDAAPPQPLPGPRPDAHHEAKRPGPPGEATSAPPEAPRPGRAQEQRHSPRQRDAQVTAGADPAPLRPEPRPAAEPPAAEPPPPPLQRAEPTPPPPGPTPPRGRGQDGGQGEPAGAKAAEGYDPAAPLPSEDRLRAWTKLVHLLRKEEPTLGSAASRARLLPAREGWLVLGFTEPSIATDRLQEHKEELQRWLPRVMGQGLEVEVRVGPEARDRYVPSVYEEEERLELELIQSRKARARDLSLVKAVQLQLDGTIQEILVHGGKEDRR